MVKSFMKKTAAVVCTFIPLYINKLYVGASSSQYDFLMNGSDPEMNKFLDALKEEGSGIIMIFALIAIIGLLLAVLSVGAGMMLSSTGRMTAEYKQRIKWLFISGAGIFGIFFLVDVMYVVGTNFLKGW